jgi:hypothetical protein
VPTWSGILQELQASRSPAGLPDFDGVRRRYLTALHQHTNRAVILYASNWTQAGNIEANLISVVEEDVQGLMEVVHGIPEGPLDLILHTPGGSAEATEMVVQYLRSKFSDIRVIVPQAAMSAGTLLACAANVIVMGKHSALGPVDPQFVIGGPGGGRLVPAQAILDQFERAKTECQNPKLLGAWAPILAFYGPALLVQCDNAKQLSHTLVKEWTQKWMFAGEPDAETKALAVANQLGDHSYFRSHARHITRDRAKEIGLIVEPLEKDQTLQDLVLSVFHATTHTFSASLAVKIIENHLGKAFVKLHIPQGAQLVAQGPQPSPVQPAPAQPAPVQPAPVQPPP